MSITKETAAQHANDPAVTCCRFEAGSLVEPSILEDPAIFPDLVDSGLLNIDENVLTIGEVLGAKLTKTLDALTPITRDVVEDLQDNTATEEEVVAEESVEAVSTISTPQVSFSGGYVTVKIEEGKNIEFTFPV